MSKRSRPVAYVAPYIVGHFCFEPIKKWLGKDYWGTTIASGRTRRECEQACRDAGYKPERE